MTDYQEAALAACLKERAEAVAEGRKLSILRGVKHLYDATGKAIDIRQCKELVEWAMPRTESAAALPDGSIVATRDQVFIKNHPTATAPWRGTYGGYHGDWYMDAALRDGASVLRVGYGQKEE